MAYKPTWHLKGTPFPVQIEALKRSHGHDKYAYFLQMGLGKTALVLNDYVESFSDIPTIVVICPNSFKKDWTLAPAEWGLNFTSSMWPNDAMIANPSSVPHINVMNFESARASGYDHLRKLMDERPVFLVVDESSAIKNFKSDTARAVIDLCKRAKAVRLLNGTPMVQNVLDLFPQLKAVGQLDGVNPYAFRNHYGVMGGFMGRQIVGIRNEEELKAIQEKCSFRALKSDWWDGCPDKSFIHLNLEMTRRQIKHYREMMEDLYTLVDGYEFTANMVISKLDKLRQITSGIILDGDKTAFIEPIDKNPKALAALDLMNDDGKMIVVHFYREIGLALYDFFKRKGFNPSFIRGQMKPDAVIEQKDKFNNDSTCRIKVAQISSASMAHTLIAGEGMDRCYKMFYHDHTFSLKDRLQMDDRIHRGKQDRGCLYYEPVMSEIDKVQLKALRNKADIAAAVVDAIRALRARPS